MNNMKMRRITEKREPASLHVYTKQIRYTYEYKMDLDKQDNAITKLGNFEDIEEKVNFNLTIIIKALELGIIDKTTRPFTHTKVALEYLKDRFVLKSKNKIFELNDYISTWIEREES